jgi:hypothetical protein
VADLTSRLYAAGFRCCRRRYDFSNVCDILEFSVRPFAAMRDFHALQSDAAYSAPTDGFGRILIKSGDSKTAF